MHRVPNHWGWILFWLVTMSHCVSAMALAPPQTSYVDTSSTAQPSQKNILVLGDSLSAAFNINPARGWVNIFAQRVKPFDYTVINASISGLTTSQGLKMLPKLLDEHQPAIIIVELGANDGLQGRPHASIRKNLTQMITSSQQFGADVFLVGTRLPPNLGRRYIQPYLAVFTELAKQFQLPFVPYLLAGVAEKSALMQGDGLHPREEAQPEIADTVWSVFGAPLTKTRQK